MQGKLDLAKEVLRGYESARSPELPHIKISAIANDTVSTLVSFAYQFRSKPRSKPAMGLIVGTGCNATIPLALSKLHLNKRPKQVKILGEDESEEDVKIALNTEWSINGAAQPLRDLGFITSWDSKLDEDGDLKGFQPFEYMTAGRYLGELGRIIIVDYFTNHLQIPESELPSNLRQPHHLLTPFLGNLGPHLAEKEPSLLKQLEGELPSAAGTDAWKWTPRTASMVLKIAKAVQVRAAGLAAAAVIGLLACAGEIDFQHPLAEQPLTNGKAPREESAFDELLIGYTGGCINHFQDYLADCQASLDAIMDAEFEGRGRPRVLLKPCDNGGIIGAGILAGTMQSIAHDDK